MPMIAIEVGLLETCYVIRMEDSLVKMWKIQAYRSVLMTAGNTSAALTRAFNDIWIKEAASLDICRLTV